MKKANLLILIFISLLHVSCNDRVELDDSWLIEKMMVGDSAVYPKTFHESISINFTPAGYEEYEEIRFNVKDSTVIIPGFNSEKYVMGFSVQRDTLFFIDNRPERNKHAYYMQNLFDEPFLILNHKKEEYLELKSDSVYLMLLSEKGLTSKRINNLYNN